MSKKKAHLWKGEYRNFIEIAKLESVSYDVLKKAFYKVRDIKKAVEYSKGTFSFSDRVKYEYKGKMYNQIQLCTIIAKDVNLTVATVKGRLKANWTIDEIISTPKNKLCKRKQLSYNQKLGAQVKIYDLENNLLYECNTYGEAAKYLNTKTSTVVSTCHRSGILFGKYKVQSKASTLEKKEFSKKQRLSKNKNWCKLKYSTVELNQLASKRCKEITRDLYYNNNKDVILEKMKEYYNSNREMMSLNRQVYYVTNKEFLQIKHKEWVTRNKEKQEEYHKNYRRNASDNLSDVYIKTTLATTLKLSADQITPEMIEIKRKQVKLYRELK